MKIRLTTFFAALLIPAWIVLGQTYWNPDSTGYNYLSRGKNLSQWTASPGTTIEIDTAAFLNASGSIKWTVPANSGVTTLELNLIDIDLADRVVYTRCRRNLYASRIEAKIICTSKKWFRLPDPVEYNDNGNHLRVNVWHHRGQSSWLSPFADAPISDLRHVSKILFRAENAAVEQILWINEIKYTRPRGPACIIHFNHYRDTADSLLTPWLIARGYPANIDFTYDYAQTKYEHIRPNGNFGVRYIGLERIAALVNQHGWSVTHHGVFYDTLTTLPKEERMRLYSLEPFQRFGFQAHWCFSIPMDRATPAIRAEIDSLKRFHAVRDQWARTPNELPIDNPARLRFYRITSASASPNLNGQPETLAQMRSRVYTAFLRKGLLIFNIESIVAAPTPDYAGTVELSMLSDDQALIEYADSLGFTFLTFRKLFEADPNYQHQLSINHDYLQIQSGSADTLRILQNDLSSNHDDLRIVAITRPQHGHATINQDQKVIFYQPNRSFFGIDRFQYVASNGNLSDTAWVFIKILPTAIAATRTVPIQTTLYPNYPNPFYANGNFNNETSFTFTVARPTHVTLSVYNMLGQEVIRLVDAEKPTGSYKLLWNGKNAIGQKLPSGVYLCKLNAEGIVRMTKMLFLN
jgi:hypothetical protein